MTDTSIMNVSQRSSAVMSHTLIKRIPVNYTPNTVVMYGDQVLFDVRHTVRDNDMKVFLCALKAYTDNKYDAIQNAKESPLNIPDQLDIIIEDDFAHFVVDTKEMSSLVYPNDSRTRPKRLLDSMENMAGIKIYLLDELGNKRGFVQLLSKAILSPDRKTMKVGINKDFVRDMSRQMVQYNFPKMLSLTGINFRLYIAMQQRKYYIKKGKYGYTNIEHNELCDILNIHNTNAKTKIEDAFRSIGIDFVLHSNGKWQYRKKEVAKNDNL